MVERHLDEGVAALTSVLADLRDAPPPLADGTARLVEAMVALHRERPRLHRVLFEEAPRPPALRRRLAALEAALTAGVADYLRACGDAVDPARDPDVAARLVVQVVETVTHELVLRPGATPIDTYASETVALLCGYLAR